MEQKRDSFGSTLGFLFSAIGSAVGLGNIWGFPYKMGRSGGFSFLVVYLLLGVFVGFVIMMGELALGRKTGKGVIGAYGELGKKFKWVGALAVFAPFAVMTFYAVLGAYCMEYLVLNMSNLAFGSASVMTGADLFTAMCTNPFGALMFTVLFMVICYVINRSGVSGGIEKFSTIGMPALFVMLVIIIIRSLTLDGAVEGLKFMFVPGYAVEGGFIEETPGFLTVLATAGGQMFFSLSLAMGVMVTYGSYLSKEENLVKNSLIIVVSDTLVAIMAGLAVLPAAVATYGPSATLSGPKLLFITLQDVFHSMGTVGPLFGVAFYSLVLLAAITSAISLIEVVVTYLLDRTEEKGKQGSRSKTVLGVCVAIMAVAAIVAVDGLGQNGIWVPFQNTFGVIGEFNDCWLDFVDCLAEGIAMPLGALIMSIIVGWVIKPETLLDEIHIGGTDKLDGFFRFCIKFVAPVGMLLILIGQIDTFFHLGIF